MRIIKNLLTITLPVLVVLIIVIELLLRLFPVEDPYLRFKNRYENYFIPSQMPANVTYRMKSMEGLKNIDTAITYSTNNVGFRGDSLAIPKPSTEFRVFIIGGSTAQCLYIDDSKAFGRVLQNELQKVSNHKTIKVYTAAKSGDATADHVAMLSQRIIHLQPDLVIFFSGINDLRRSIQGYDYMHLRSPKMYTPGYLYLLATDFQVGRRIYHLIKKPGPDELREMVPLQTNYQALFAAQQRTPVSDSMPYINATHYAINLRTVAGICRQNNVSLVFMPNQDTWTSPTMKGKHWLLTCGSVRYRADVLKMGLDIFNDSMKAVARQLSVPVYDLPSSIPPVAEYFYDDCHFTDQGSVLCGRNLAEFIINNNLSDTVYSVSTFKYK